MFISYIFKINTFVSRISYLNTFVSLSGSQLNTFNSAWNNVYRKIFHTKPWESVKEIQILCGRLDIKHLIDLSKMRFVHSISTSSTCILHCCMSKALRSSTVKTSFYSYSGFYVRFSSVFSKLKNSLIS